MTSQMKFHDVWNGQHASVVNKMPASAQEDDDHHSMQTT